MKARHTALLSTCIVTLAVSCTPAAKDAGNTPSVPSSTEQSASATPSSPPPEPTYFTITSGGDILLHLSVNDLASAGSSYDYTPLFAGISDYISGSDLALCSLEVPIVPDGEAPSNYPSMGSPPEIADSLKAMGWDGCALATNHTMDRGFDGIASTISHFDRVGLGHAGTAATQEEASQIQYYTVRSGSRDVVVAHLSATTLTNGYPLPSEREWAWNVVGDLGIRSVDDLIDDARKARDEGADLVVVSMHWGTEYVYEPIDEQTTIAEQLAASGQVDLVFGNHSHVVEPVAKLAGGPDDQGMWVVWSMGNMISGQTVATHGYGVLAGIMTTATVEVPHEGNVHVTNLEWTSIAQDDHTYNLYPLAALVAGERPEGLRLSNAEIQGRADIIYDVMAADGSSERTTPPTNQAELVGSERK